MSSTHRASRLPPSPPASATPPGLCPRESSRVACRRSTLPSLTGFTLTPISTVAAAGGNARQARNAPAKGNAKAPAAGAGAGAGAEGGAAGAGRGRKRGPKGPKPAKRAPATLDELDAEMADYQANKGAAPAAAAPVAEAAPATVA